MYGETTFSCSFETFCKPEVLDPPLDSKLVFLIDKFTDELCVGNADYIGMN